jgi:hypothetical protein
MSCTGTSSKTIVINFLTSNQKMDKYTKNAYTLKSIDLAAKVQGVYIYWTFLDRWEYFDTIKELDGWGERMEGCGERQKGGKSQSVKVNISHTYKSKGVYVSGA